jgi:predicted nucleic acid-binding protein
MSKINVFLDSSALFSGIFSSQGAARVLLLLAEDEKILITISEQVVTEVERNVARKIPEILPLAREMILVSHIRIVSDPQTEEVNQHQDWINHSADVPILLAAACARVDFLVTLNTKHFLEDPEVSRRTGLRIGTPGDALAWVRGKMSEGIE